MTDSTQRTTVDLSNGTAMPLLGIGTWQMNGQEAYDAVRRALDAGYRHIDTATGYGNEDEVGRALRDSGVAREDVFVTTKLPPEHAGRERETIAASLDLLGTDFVDLWLIHWPPNGAAGVDTWRAFLDIQKNGAARAIGVSNYSPAQIDELIQETGTAPAVNQIKWSPHVFDAARLEHSRKRGVVLEGYSPFKAGGLHDPVVAEIAEAHGVTPAQVVLRWHIDHDIVAIPKSVQPERIVSNFDIFGFSLTADEVARIDGTSTVS
jgi:diketogulonate reductase-like aldo/keto reductase